MALESAPTPRKCGVCGAICQEPDEPPEAWIGRTVDGKYIVERVLGVGGMGMVFEASRVLVGDKVALKGTPHDCLEVHCNVSFLEMKPSRRRAYHTRMW